MSSYRIHPIILIASLALLWLGTASIAFSSDGLNQGDFLPIALHASKSADYSVDELAQFAPVDPDIVKDMQSDNGQTPIEPTSSGSDEIVQNEPNARNEDDEDDGGQTQSGGSTQTSSDDGQIQGNGNGNGNGNGGNGNGNGNNPHNEDDEESDGSDGEEDEPGPPDVPPGQAKKNN